MARLRFSVSDPLDPSYPVRLSHYLYGDLPASQLSLLARNPWTPAESWPSLGTVPDRESGASLQEGARPEDHARLVGEGVFRAIARQWWGHSVAPASYRDEWLVEGFTELTTVLTVEQVKGESAARRFWEQARRSLLAPDLEGLPVASRGPINRGWRRAAPAEPGAHRRLLALKGAFVLQMLRMLMWDPDSWDHDARFAAMTREFASAFAGRSASTEDFKLAVERHMVPAMNAAGDGTMDWFFDQWVHGTEIPRLVADLRADRVEGKDYRISGEVTLSEVSEGFRALVSLYAELSQDRLASFGRVPFAGPGTRQVDVTVKLPEKPRRILANAHFEVLARE
jgi:hypothetical protein